MPAIVEWNRSPQAFKQLRTFLQGRYRCRCGNQTHEWQWTCAWCGGAFEPQPLVPVQSQIIVNADDAFTMLASLGRLQPAQFKPFDVDVVVEPFGDDYYVLLRDMQSEPYRPSQPWKFTLANPEQAPIEYQDGSFGLVPMTVINWPQFQQSLRPDSHLVIDFQAMKPIRQAMFG